MAITAGFFIISGWVSRGELYSSGSQIKNLPIQSDMNSGRRWIRPANTADVVRPARLVDTPTGQRFGYGGLVFVWPMQGLSPEMVAYLQNTYFGTGSNFFERGWSKKLTVQTFNRASGQWETYNVIWRFPNLDGEAEPALGGYNNFQIFFTAYRIAAEGADLSIAVTLPVGSIYTNTDWTFQTTATNDGDDSTFDDTVFSYAIPDNFTYVSATSGSPITINYSINDGATYSGTPPMDLSTVTNIKVFYTDLLAAGETSSNINITLTPVTISTGDASTISVTTEGDGSGGTKSNTHSLNIIAWIPTAVSGLELWLKGDSLVFSDVTGTTPATNLGTVARWNDSSGNMAGRYALQVTGGNRGTYKTGLANGHAAVQFDAVSSHNMAIQFSAITGSHPMTVGTVIDAEDDTSAGVPQYILDWPTGVSDQITFAHIDNDTKTSVATYRTDWAKFQLTANSLQTYTYINRTHVSTGRRLYWDGTISTDFSSTEATVINGAILAANRAATSAFFNGKIYELVVYSTALTGQALTNLNDYLKSKYGIS